MFFKGCPRPLGCTVLLQGADAEQLTLLKKVMKVMKTITIAIVTVVPTLVLVTIKA